MVLGVKIWSVAEARGGKNFKFQRGLVSEGARTNAKARASEAARKVSAMRCRRLRRT
jgi:hypothetical protein